MSWASLFAMSMKDWKNIYDKIISTPFMLRNAKGLSRTNIYYAKKFYLLYSKYVEFVPQTAGQLKGADKSHVSTSEIVPHVATLSWKSRRHNANHWRDREQVKWKSLNRLPPFYPLPFMQNSHKWHFYLHFSCSIQNKSLPLHREPALGMSVHHRRRVADIIKKRLLALVLVSRNLENFTLSKTRRQ